MKKISLSKETLRVLTAQETAAVAGGDLPTTNSVNLCPQLTRNTCVRTACGGCTGTTTTTVQTAPNATCVPQTRNGGRLCEAEPYTRNPGCEAQL